MLSGLTALALGGYFKYRQYEHNTLAVNVNLARESTLPKVMGESVYTAITCSGSNIAESHLFSEREPVFWGRISVAERERECIWMWSDASKTFLRHCTTNVKREHHKCFNTHLICEKNGENIGPVEAHHLDAAEWQSPKYLEKTTYSENLHRNTDAASTLKYLQIPITDDIYNYVITKEWYENAKVFILADVKKNQNGYEITKPENQPFIVTLKSEEEIAQQAKNYAWYFEMSASVMCVAASVLFANACFQFAKEEFNSLHGSTALIQAIIKDRFYTKFLIKNSLFFRKDLNSQDKDGKTALMWASSFRNDRIVNILIKSLIEQNSDLNICDNQGKTAIMLARQGASQYVGGYAFAQNLESTILSASLERELRRNNPQWVSALNNIIKEYLGGD